MGCDLNPRKSSGRGLPVRGAPGRVKSKSPSLCCCRCSGSSQRAFLSAPHSAGKGPLHLARGNGLLFPRGGPPAHPWNWPCASALRSQPVFVLRTLSWLHRESGAWLDVSRRLVSLSFHRQEASSSIPPCHPPPTLPPKILGNLLNWVGIHKM